MSSLKKPTILKIVEGTARADRMNKNEPEPEIEIPSCPAQLSPGAKAEWFRIAPLLEDQGLLSKHDRTALAAYCELYARWIKALSRIKRSGEVIETPNGSQQVSPWLSIARSAEKEMRAYLGLFGMSPSDRGKVTAKKKEAAKDPLARLFK